MSVPLKSELLYLIMMSYDEEVNQQGTHNNVVIKLYFVMIMYNDLIYILWS